MLHRTLIFVVKNGRANIEVGKIGCLCFGKNIEIKINATENLYPQHKMDQLGLCF